MLDPRALTHAQLAEIVADVQAILWQESRMLPDDPRQYGDYWNPGKEDDGEGLELSSVITAACDPPASGWTTLPSKLSASSSSYAWANRLNQSGESEFSRGSRPPSCKA